MNTVYFARYIYLGNGAILSNGAVAVHGTRIVDVAPRGRVKRTRKDRLVNLGDILLLPGFINMHTHLEECVVRGERKTAEESFTSFISRKGELVRSCPRDTLLASMRLTVRELLAQGITTIVDSSSLNLSANILREENVRSWIINEIDQNNNSAPELDTDGSDSPTKTLQSKGLGPHAIYTAPPQIQKKIIQYTYEKNCVWATHLGESSEELQAFSEQKGDLFSLVSQKSSWPFVKTECGSVHYAITANLIPSNGICFHCNYANGHELALLSAKGVSVVLCNQYTQLMGHKSFPLEVALNRGVSICLGTEGVAAAGEMSLFDELYSLRMAHPHIPAKEMIKWVTENPAAALGMSKQLGSILPGKFADIIGVRFAHDQSEDMLEEMLVQDLQVEFVLIDGEEVVVNY